MHYAPKYCEFEEDSYILREAINNGLLVVNQTDAYDTGFASLSYQFVTHPLDDYMPLSPSSDYSDCSVHSMDDEDSLCCGISSRGFSDVELDKVLQGIIELEEDLQKQSPPVTPTRLIPTTVYDSDDTESGVFCRGYLTPPPTPSAQLKPNNGVVRRRRRQRQRQLWQFLLELLNDGRYNPSVIEWVQRDMGVFRFVKPRSAAELWGRRRQRANMTYEHLSRAMRYYYKRNVMRRVADHGRLVYQFLSNAEGWREYTNRGRG